MQTDPISDFLTSIRNAAAAKHQRVDVPASKLKSEIARILKEEGYISTFKNVDENKTHRMLRVFLKYTPDRRSVISGLKRISRPGARCYVGAMNVKRVADDHRAVHGLARALVANAVHGVTLGFKKDLDIVGVGYRAELKGKIVAFALGKSHPVEFPVPEGIQIAVDKQTHLVVTG